MKRALATVLLLLLVAAVAQAEETLRLATLNCEFLVRSEIHVKYGLAFSPKDWTVQEQAVWNQPGYRDARFSEAARAVGAAVKRIGADLIVLCEVGDAADCDELRREIAGAGLDYPYWAVCNSADTATGQHVAVFSLRLLESVAKSIPGREGFDTELDDPDAEDDTGISKGIEVVFRAAGQPIHLFGVHFASERGGHEQDAQRVAQASIVRRNYLDLLNAGQYVIVAGDLNDRPGDPAIRRIRGRDDIFADLADTGQVRFFDRQSLDTRWTYEYQGVREQLDYVLLSSSILEACFPSGIRAETMAVTETIPSTGQRASDHRALVVTLRWR